MPRINMILMASMSEEYHKEFLEQFEDKGFISVPIEFKEGIAHIQLSRLTEMV